MITHNEKKKEPTSQLATCSRRTRLILNGFCRPFCSAATFFADCLYCSMCSSAFRHGIHVETRLLTAPLTRMFARKRANNNNDFTHELRPPPGPEMTRKEPSRGTARASSSGNCSRSSCCSWPTPRKEEKEEKAAGKRRAPSETSPASSSSNSSRRRRRRRRRWRCRRRLRLGSARYFAAAGAC